MSLDYKILGQELVSYTDVPGTEDTTSYYVSYEEAVVPLFVAVGSDPSSSSYSTDGITWTESSLPEFASWESVTYGGGKFVAIASTPSYTAAYSTDGITWTESSLPQDSSWKSVTYGDGKFVAVGQGVSGAYSTDGITWTQSSMSGGIWGSVTYGDGKFVAVSGNPYSTPALAKSAYSTDGITWAESPMPDLSSYWNKITYGGGKFVATSIQGPAAYSTDGTTWTQFSLPAGDFWSLGYGSNKFVAVSWPNLAAYSTDGITWTQASMPANADWSSVTYGNSQFVAVGYGPSVAAYSTDGITWTQSSISPGTWNSVTHGEGVQLTETLNIIGGQGTTQTEEYLPVTIYTVPANKQTTVTSIFVANHNNVETTYDLAVISAGEELSLKHHIRWDMPIAAGDFESLNTKITMSAGDKLVIFPSTVDTVSITAFGVEK